MSNPKARRPNGPSLLQQIKDRCLILEDYVRSRSLASAGEMADYAPGGAENTIEKAGEKPWAWVRWIMALSRFLEREESRETERNINEADVLAALNSEPISVVLSGNRKLTVLVYPKSMEALVFCHARDFALGWLTEKLKKVKLDATANDAELLELLMEEMAFQYQLLCWAVTHEGPGLPFNPRELRQDPDLIRIPDWVQELQPWDVQRIAIAFAQVNVLRISAASSLSDSETRSEGGKRPSWSVFLGTLALEKGADMRDLFRNADLPRLLVEVQLANEGRRDPKAEKREKERREKEEREEMAAAAEAAD